MLSRIHKSFIIYSVLFANVLFVWPTTAISQESCEIAVASSRIPTRSVYPNSKIEVNAASPKGFLEPSDKTPVVHGIDVSKHQQTADFSAVKACGGTFAYVRLSAGNTFNNERRYYANWPAARSAGLIVGPYHTLSMLKPSDDDKANNYELFARANKRVATEQAKLFLTNLVELLANWDSSNKSEMFGEPFLPPVVAATVDPIKSSSLDDKKWFGAFYSEAICQWIDTVSESGFLAKDKIILMTTPSIFSEYGFADARCDLKTIPIWIVNFTANGDREFLDPDPERAARASELCVVNGESRCLIHQYTPFGRFATFQDKSAVDLNRFYGTALDLGNLLQQVSRENIGTEYLIRGANR